MKKPFILMYLFLSIAFQAMASKTPPSSGKDSRVQSHQAGESAKVKRGGEGQNPQVFKVSLNFREGVWLHESLKKLDKEPPALSQEKGFLAFSPDQILKAEEALKLLEQARGVPEALKVLNPFVSRLSDPHELRGGNIVPIIFANWMKYWGEGLNKLDQKIAELNLEPGLLEASLGQIWKKKEGELQAQIREIEGLFESLDQETQHVIFESDVRGKDATLALLRKFFSTPSNCRALTFSLVPSPLQGFAFPDCLLSAGKELCMHEKLEEISLEMPVDLEGLKVVTECAPRLKKIHFQGVISPLHLEHLATNLPHLESLCLQEDSRIPLLGLSLYHLGSFSGKKKAILAELAGCIAHIEEKIDETVDLTTPYTHPVFPSGASYPLLNRMEAAPDPSCPFDIARIEKNLGLIKEKIKKYIGLYLCFMKERFSGQEEPLAAAEYLTDFLMRADGLLGGLLKEDPSLLVHASSFAPLGEIDSVSEDSSKRLYFSALKNLTMVSDGSLTIAMETALWTAGLEYLHLVQANLDSPRSGPGFTKGLSKCDFSGLKGLKFSRAHVEGLTLELPLKAPHLETFCLDNCLGLKESDLLTLLRGMPNLKNLTLNDSLRKGSSSSSQGLRAVREKIILPYDRSLRSLSLCGNGIEDADLCDILATQKSRDALEILDLSENGITDQGMEVLAKRYFPRLEKLILQGNSWTGAEGLEALRKGRRNFPELKYINLCDTVKDLSQKNKKIYKMKVLKAFPEAVVEL